MKFILPLVALLFLGGCVRDTSTEIERDATASLRAVGTFMGAPLDVTLDGSAETSSAMREHYESRLNVEAVKEVVAPIVDAAVQLGLSKYFPHSRMEPADSSPLGDYGDDAAAVGIMALLANHFLAERRKKKRDETAVGS